MSMRACRCAFALLACCGTTDALSVPGVDYSLLNHRVNFVTGASVTPVKLGSFGIGPGVQADTLSLIEPAGHSIASVTYNAALGKTGWKVDTASAFGTTRYESEASLVYNDAVALAVVGSTPAGGLVTLSVKIDGSFSGTASRGSTGFELTALGSFAGVSLNRAPNPAAPGMDLITRTDTGGSLPPTFFAAASGAAFPFTETLSLVVPLAALGAAVPVLAPTTGIRPFPFARDCVPSPPEIVCMVRLGGPTGAGPVPLPIAFAVTDTLTRAGGGVPAGTSIIDQMNTATLSVQVPAGVHFLLESGALVEDPASLFAVLPIVAVPEPNALLLMTIGIALIVLRSSNVRVGRYRPALC